MKIIGIDPGIHITGYGIISETDGEHNCLGWGAIRTKAGALLPFKLKQIADGIRAAICKYNPDCLAMEESFFAKNPNSALKLGIARGVVMLVAEEAGLTMDEYSPLLIKQTVTGYGGADKRQVKIMVRHILSLKEDPSPLDASDALAVAITHASHTKLSRKATG